jgi:hypothetical protein
VTAVARPNTIRVPIVSAKTEMYASTPEVVVRDSTADHHSDVAQTVPSSSASTSVRTTTR